MIKLFLLSAVFFFKINCFEKLFQEIDRNTIRVSNNLDPYQAQICVGHDLGPNCLQMLSAGGTSR